MIFNINYIVFFVFCKTKKMLNFVQQNFSDLMKFKDLWNRDNDGDKKEQRSFLRCAIVATSLFLIFVCFVSTDNLYHWAKAKFTIYRQEKRIEQYRREISEMERKIDMLSNNRDSLERFARENFNFASPGDDIFVLDED